MKRISMKIKALAEIMTFILTLTAIPALADGTTDLTKSRSAAI